MTASHGVVARAMGKRIAPLLVLTALLMLAGDPRPSAVPAGLFFAAGIALYAIVFGAARATTAFPPAMLRTLIAWGVCLAAGAGVFASTGRMFSFSVIAVAGAPISIGGALMHLGAFVTVAAGVALVFLCLAARVAPDGDRQ